MYFSEPDSNRQRHGAKDNAAKAEEYFYNSFFRVKMLLLALIFIHGWMFRGSVYDKTAEIDLAIDRVPG